MNSDSIFKPCPECGTSSPRARWLKRMEGLPPGGYTDLMQCRVCEVWLAWAHPPSEEPFVVRMRDDD